MFSKIKFLRLPSHKRFEYQPLYYNPIKEELEERKKNILDEMKAEREGTGKIEQRFSKMRGIHERSSNLNKNRNLRIIIIVLVLFAIAYYLRLF